MYCKYFICITRLIKLHKYACHINMNRKYIGEKHAVLLRFHVHQSKFCRINKIIQLWIQKFLKDWGGGGGGGGGERGGGGVWGGGWGGGGVGEYFLFFVYLWNCLVFFQFVLFCKGLKRSFD